MHFPPRNVRARIAVALAGRLTPGSAFTASSPALTSPFAESTADSKSPITRLLARRAVAPAF
jgi:hypothetical protein